MFNYIKCVVTSVTTTLARCRAPVFQNKNSNQNATCSSLKHHSKRATSVGIHITGDSAKMDRVWTRVVAREPIAKENQ